MDTILLLQVLQVENEILPRHWERRDPELACEPQVQTQLLSVSSLCEGRQCVVRQRRPNRPRQVRHI
jgi:hypothetical protein